MGDNIVVEAIDVAWRGVVEAICCGDDIVVVAVAVAELLLLGWVAALLWKLFLLLGGVLATLL
jgi:hypothetical protein